MKHLRHLVGHRVVVQLEFDGVGAEGQLDSAAADGIWLVDVSLHSGRAGDEPRVADGAIWIPAARVVWVQFP